MGTLRVLPAILRTHFTSVTGPKHAKLHVQDGGSCRQLGASRMLQHLDARFRGQKDRLDAAHTRTGASEAGRVHGCCDPLATTGG
jgi:hypothetical protein